jgi:M penetrans paralogue family 26
MSEPILDSNFQNPERRQHSYLQKDPLPNATATLVLGICSIVTCFCYGIPGLACGIIALVISKKSVELYKEDPDRWSDWPNLNAGRICAIIGIILGALYLIFIIVYFAFIGTMIMNAPGGPFSQ